MLRPVHIGGYGVGDWKSQYGVSDEGASSAGVYGTPASSWDVARAQEETRRLQAPVSGGGSGDLSMGGYVHPPAYVDTPGHRHIGVPGPHGNARTSASSGWLKLLLLACVLPVAVAALGFVGILVLGMLGGGAAPQTLDTAHYERLSDDARRLSTQPASRLYTTWLSRARPEWSTLDAPQRHAVAAAWIRYTRNPDSFERLVPEQKTYVFAAFASYLQALSAAGDAQATRDLAWLEARR